MWNVVVDYCMIADVGEGPNGYRPKVFQVPIGYAIGACGSCWLGAVYCCFCNVGGERRGGSVRGLIFWVFYLFLCL